MHQTFCALWIHFIWATKHRQATILPPFRFKLYDEMRAIAKEKEYHLDFVNGTADHIHCLLSLKTNRTISDVAKNLKGGSSHWLNESHWIDENFDWQDGYAAISVSPSNVPQVRNYIKNQEIHHAAFSFDEEMELLKKKSRVLLISH